MCLFLKQYDLSDDQQVSIKYAILTLKDGLDDYNRHKSDRLVNNREVELLDPQIAKLRPEKWMYIRTGDIIKIQEDTQITADVILLRVFIA